MYGLFMRVNKFGDSTDLRRRLLLMLLLLRPDIDALESESPSSSEEIEFPLTLLLLPGSVREGT